MHRLIADKIRQDPALFEKVKDTLARWRLTVCANSQPYLVEWERLVGEGIEACLAVAVEDSERATALRQSAPFCGVLSEAERINFLSAWARDHGRECDMTPESIAALLDRPEVKAALWNVPAVEAAGLDQPAGKESVGEAPWLDQMVTHMDRMAVDEAYRQEIAKKLS